MLEAEKKSIQILLVNLPFPFSRYNTYFEKKDYEEHLGLESLASVLRVNGFSVRIIDAHAESLSVEDIISEIIDNEYKLVGFSLFQFSVNLLGDICKSIKQLRKNIHLTCGGHFVTGSYKLILEHFDALDSVIRGEGEHTLCELASKVIANEDWRQIPGMAYRKDGVVSLSPHREMITDLDLLPYPSRDFLDNKLHKGKSIDTINIYSSRGCYGTCTFCSIKAFYDKTGPAWRARSAKNVVDELEYLNSKYKPNRFMFVDDNFIGIGKRGKLRVIEIAQEIIKRNLKISFMISCRVNDVEPALFYLLIKAGLVEVFLGIESFSNRELDFFNKLIRCGDSFKTIEFLQKMNIAISAGFIMFTPNTRLEDIKRNIKYLKKYGMMDEGKFTFINRIVGSAFDMNETPGMLDSDFNIFDYPLNGKTGYNIFDDKASQLAEIIRSQYLTLRGFNTLRKCKKLLSMAEELHEYSLYDLYIGRISNNNVNLNVTYIENIIHTLNGAEFTDPSNRLKRLKACWDSEVRLVRNFLSEVKSFLLKGTRALWRFYLSPNVIIVPQNNGRIRYINTISDSYVIVDDRNHNIIQALCNLNSMTYENILEKLCISGTEFIGLIKYLLDRYIIDYENISISKWEKLSKQFYLTKNKIVCWDVNSDAIDNSDVYKIAKLLIKNEFSSLKISSQRINGQLLEAANRLASHLNYIAFETSIHNYSELREYTDCFDQFIFVISVNDLLNSSKMILDLHKELSSKMPEAPVFLIKEFGSNILEVIGNMDIQTEVKILYSGTEDYCSLNQYKEISMLAESDSNIALVYGDLEKFYYGYSDNRRQKTYIGYNKSVYIYSK